MEVGDFLPAVGRDEQVRPGGELDVSVIADELLVLLDCLRGERGRHRVILSAPTIRSGARRSFLKCTSLGGPRWKLAKPAS